MSKEKYKAQVIELIHILNEWDSYSLIESGFPDNEFEPEALELLLAFKVQKL